MRRGKRHAAAGFVMAVLATALVLAAGLLATPRGACESDARGSDARGSDAAGATPRLERVGGEANPCNCTQRVEP